MILSFKSILYAFVAIMFSVGAGALVSSQPLRAQALPEIVLESVVSVLPVWPGRPQGGAGVPRGTAPEGSGIAISDDGHIATAYHVIGPAIVKRGQTTKVEIDVRLSDGRVLPARLVAFDLKSDIAVLKVEKELPRLESGPRPGLGDRTCIVSNAYGLDLSVTCGVVSARHVSNAGFNPVEDFIQTDAAANPGSSGGALIDGQGRLIGMVSAIFASGEETNIGVNFAVSSDLLTRVAQDLIRTGKVGYVVPGWQLARLDRSMLRQHAGAQVRRLEPGGVAEKAGILSGDIVTGLAGRPIKGPSDAVSAAALIHPGQAVPITIRRRDETIDFVLRF